MLYDRNYRDQMFWETEYYPTLTEFFTRLRQVDYRDLCYPPKGKAFGLAVKGFGTAFAVGVLTGVISWLVTGSGVFGLVLGMMAFFGIGIVVAFLIARKTLVTEPAKMTSEVNAKCIGYSLSGSGKGGGVLRTPVFQYNVGGREYIAYDGVYTRHSRMPAIDEYCSIWVNPEEPEYMKWDDAHNMKTFIFAAFVCAIIFLVWIGMTILVIRDPGLRGAELTAMPSIVDDLLKTRFF
ncbi:MAG: hypothetical protein J5685_01635 [Clostridiales bacterium]|nr:hypothetical protein [Clostridiales bacterium]